MPELETRYRPKSAKGKKSYPVWRWSGSLADLKKLALWLPKTHSIRVVYPDEIVFIVGRDIVDMETLNKSDYIVKARCDVAILSKTFFATNYTPSLSKEPSK